jgi:large conductance mechanosensitive channel
MAPARPTVGGFREFLTKTNALALAVGVIIGASLGAVVNSLVKDVIMPPVGWALGGVDFTQMKYVLGTNAAGEEVAINYGLLINAIITFIVVALVVYLISLWFIRQEEEAPTRECPFCKETNAETATRCKSCTSELPAAAPA